MLRCAVIAGFLGLNAWSLSVGASSSSLCDGLAAKTAIDKTLEHLVSRPQTEAAPSYVVMLEELNRMGDRTYPIPQGWDSIEIYDAGILVRVLVDSLSPDTNQHTMEIHSQTLVVGIKGGACAVIWDWSGGAHRRQMTSPEVPCENLALIEMTKAFTDKLLLDGEDLSRSTLILPSPSELAKMQKSTEDGRVLYLSEGFSVYAASSQGKPVAQTYQTAIKLEKKGNTCRLPFPKTKSEISVQKRP